MADDPEQLLPAGPTGPRVLLVVDDESLERFGAIPKHIVVGLADAAVRVTVLARTARPPSALELGPCAAIHDPPRRWELRRRLPEEIDDLAREGKIDLVQCLSADLLERMLRFPELARVPLAAHIADHTDLRRWETVAARRQNLWALPATPTLFRDVLETRTVRSRNMRLVRLAVIGHTGSPILADPDHIPSAMVMTPLVPDCGLVQVLHAMHLIASTNPEVTLFVLGQGPAEREFRLLVQQLSLQHTVVFVGSLSQWADALLGCDILVLPRPRARWTSHVLEAMAAGRVILATRDLEEDYLVDDQTACLFDPTDMSDLSTRWRKLITEPATAQRLGAAARHFVKTQHGLSVMADALVEFYRQVMGQRPAVGPGADTPAS